MIQNIYNKLLPNGIFYDQPDHTKSRNIALGEMPLDYKDYQKILENSYPKYTLTKEHSNE
ncbi:MAG: hypothetical protein M0R17_00015 [Candidatus Omnitrophica bacterium]|jgi:hypothetical protein|nr:hypothetical protein [Candidatus Omnitrophota bacterium]